VSESASPGWRSRLFSFNTYNRAEWVAAEAARLPSGSRVLDVGAGIGQYREMFSHCEYRTQDFGKEPGTQGRYVPLDYTSDITSIPVPDASFDAVLCTEVLEHVPEPIEAVREMARILRPGGVLLLTAPLGSHLHQEPYHFYGGYTPHWYRRVLEACCLELLEIDRNKGFFSFFGQEALRFHDYLRPEATRQLNWTRRLVLVALWIMSFPLSRILPLVGVWLDSLGLEHTATVGYHVRAARRSDPDGLAT
jgi:SAM-dependent methyltransferase